MQSIVSDTVGSVVSDVTNVIVPVPRKPLSKRAAFLMFAKRILYKLINFLKTTNWKSAKTWIVSAMIARALYVAMNEYGWNPFKKIFKDDHVFLTGAGGGIGRLVAIRLGKMGCKLSLSDINMAALEETKQVLINEGIPAASINIFTCDVSKRVSITEAAL